MLFEANRAACGHTVTFILMYVGDAIADTVKFVLPRIGTRTFDNHDPFLSCGGPIISRAHRFSYNVRQMAGALLSVPVLCLL